MKNEKKKKTRLLVCIGCGRDFRSSNEDETTCWFCKGHYDQRKESRHIPEELKILRASGFGTWSCEEDDYSEDSFPTRE